MSLGSKVVPDPSVVTFASLASYSQPPERQYDRHRYDTRGQITEIKEIPGEGPVPAEIGIAYNSTCQP